MSDVINLGTRVSNLDVSPQFDTYSKVIIHIDDETQVSAGNNSGRVFEMDNPLGTQAFANEILQKLRGFQYQPYQADGAMLDPAAEIGDAVDTPSVYGGIYTRSRTFGRLMKADVSAPCDEEINHEYEFESPTERKFKREMGDVRASLIIQSNMIQAEVVARQNADNEMSSRITQTANAITAEVSARQTAVDGLRTETNTKFSQTDAAITAEVNRASTAEGNLSASLSIQASEIAAKVSASGGGDSFSWVMNSSSHTWKSNNTDVMRISASGLWLKGQIEASSGKIGGFDIGANALTYNGLNWGDTSKNYGAYVGQSGIQLGKSFQVDNSGNVLASSLKLKGSITFLNADGTTAGTMSAADLRLGAQRANSGYSDWNSAYNWTDNNGSYCTGGASYGYGYGNATRNGTSSYPSYFTCGYLRVTSGISMSGAVFTPKTKTIGGTTITYLGA